MKRSFTSEQLADLLTNHYPSTQLAIDPDAWKQLKALCQEAYEQPKTPHRECYTTTAWMGNHASVLWQLRFNRMQGVYVVETRARRPIAMASYSLHDQILFGPRRTYVALEYRGGNLLAKTVLRDMFDLGKSEGKKYAVMSFNADRRGVLQFELHCNGNKMFLGDDPWLAAFKPVSDFPVMVMGVPQLCLYMPLQPELPALDPRQVELELATK